MHRTSREQIDDSFTCTGAHWTDCYQTGVNDSPITLLRYTPRLVFWYVLRTAVFCELFYGTVKISTIYSRMVKRMISWMKDLEICIHDQRYYLSICMEGLRKNHEKYPTRIASVPAEIRTQNLPNTSPLSLHQPTKYIIQSCLYPIERGRTISLRVRGTAPRQIISQSSCSSTSFTAANV